MKVIFLDIDGVLSGLDFQLTAKQEPPLIDVSRLAILKEIIHQSGAHIVLSSSWKKAWVKDSGFDLVFQKAGIHIYDTTPVLGLKRIEIAAWLSDHPDVDAFVILDDAQGGWGDLLPHVIVTDPIQEKGLEEKHIPMVLKLLEPTAAFTVNPQDFKQEVKEKWGHTEAYAQHQEKTKGYSPARWNGLAEEMDAIMAAFGACKKEGATPDSPKVQTLVNDLQNHISANYYTCTKEILAGLGQMYVADERFRTNIDRHEEGTAVFVGDAIAIYCTNQE